MTRAEPFDQHRGSAAHNSDERKAAMRSMLLWLIGVPVPIILLLALCTHHF